MAMKGLSQCTSLEVSRFRELFFPIASHEEWNSWKWQLKNRFLVQEQFKEIFGEEECRAYNEAKKRLPFGITPYYAAVSTQIDKSGGLKKTVLPSDLELEKQADEMLDPLEEEKYAMTANIVHKYPDRVLFLTHSKCAVYCRYCTRGRLAGTADCNFSKKEWDEGVEYIRKNPQIREVIVSGGDPLLLSDEQLSYILEQLRLISHIQIIRIGTKVPVTLPQRVTEKLVAMIQSYHPVFFSLHIIHPAELTVETSRAIQMLVDAGVVIASQSVLLKGVNDNLPTLQTLMEKLLFNRVRPYALYHCDRIEGAGHFRTPLESGLDLIEGLRKVSSGYAMPHYVVDPPGGKVTLAPHNLEHIKNGTYRLKNWKGEVGIYHDDGVSG